MFSVATVFLLLASLVAAAGFAVIALRRLRQLGMLAAIGATEKHLRLVLLANGAIVGAIGALAGTIAGLALWLAIAPTLEPALGHRLDRLSLPWPLLAMIVLVAMLGATAAAWWPGRAVARVPIALALSARPPRPKPAHHSAIVAVVLIAVGNRQPRALRPKHPDAHRRRDPGDDPRHAAPGPAGDSPLRPHGPARPDRVRLALRDLARYQARSGAALAAITLALGIAAAVVIIAAAEEKQSCGRTAANLSDRQIRVYTGETPDPGIIPVPTQAELEQLARRVPQLAAVLDDAAVVPLQRPSNGANSPDSSTASESSTRRLSHGRSTTPRAGRRIKRLLPCPSTGKLLRRRIAPLRRHA